MRIEIKPVGSASEKIECDGYEIKDDWFFLYSEVQTSELAPIPKKKLISAYKEIVSFRIIEDD